MPEIPVNSPLGYIGVFLLVLGIFLVLTGFNIVKIQQVTVTPGKKTWGFGLVLTIIGIVSILIETSGFLNNQPATSSTTNDIASENTGLPPDEILKGAKSWTLVHSSSFDTDDSKWVIGEFRDNGEVGKWSISDRKYLWEMKSIANDAIRYNYPALSPLDNFYVSVDINLVKESSIGVRYGLIFRGTEDVFYTFRLEDGHYYRIRRRNEDGSWDNLTDRIPSSAIQFQKVNRLSLIADGNHFLFFINDQFVHEIFDSVLPTGNVGLATTINAEGDEVILEFDNFEVREKP